MITINFTVVFLMRSSQSNRGSKRRTESKSEQQEKDGSKPEQPKKEPEVKAEQQEKHGSKPEQPEKESELKAEQEEEPPKKKKRMMGLYKVSYSYMY